MTEDSATGVVHATFDEVFSEVGDGGRWQVIMVLLTSYTAFVSSVDTFSLVYKLDEPQHWCVAPSNSSITASINHSLDSPASQLLCPRTLSCTCGGLTNDSLVQDCGRWAYNTSVYSSTVVSEWHLICGRSALRSLAVSVHMVAGLLASLLLGSLGDRVGRARAGSVCIVIFLVASLAQAATHNFIVYLLISVLTAGSHMGMYCCWYTFCVEAVGDRWRSYAGIFWLLPWSCGISCVAIAAWMLRSWRSLQLFVAVIAAPLLLCAWLMPESPRWLVERGRSRQAAGILQKIAAFNGRSPTLDLDALTQKLQPLSMCCEQTSKRAFACREISVLFGSRVMLVRSLATVWLWASIAVVYYGISFDAAQLTNSPYLSMGLAGLMELPGMACVWLIDRWGRRPVMALIYLLTAVTILPVPFVTRGWPVLVLGLFSKLVISGGFGVIYIYVEEYFPTCVRSAALGLASTSEAAGGSIAPYISFHLSKVHWSLPSVVFFVVALVAGVVVAAALPETLGKPLPATVHELTQPADVRNSAPNSQTNRADKTSVLGFVGSLLCGWRRSNVKHQTPTETCIDHVNSDNSQL